MTPGERKYRASAKGRAWKQRSNAQQTRTGRHAEGQARYDRRKAEERDNRLREELIADGSHEPRQAGRP